VLLATVNVSATHTALELQEKVLDVVGGEAVLVNVLTARMDHGFVATELFAYLGA
jgi:hypothetical protein